jgi:hypothetical protein
MEDEEVAGVRDIRRFLRAEWDRSAGYGCLVAGALVLAFGVVGVRNAADIIDEVAYLVTGGIGGIFLLGVGATLLLSADLHDDFRKLDRVEQRLDAIHEALKVHHPDLVIDLPEPVATSGPPSAGAGARAVQRARKIGTAVTGAAGAVFALGAVLVATESSTEDLSGGIGLALAGALLTGLVAVLMAGHLKGLLEQRQLAVLGPWMSDYPTTVTDNRVPAADPVWIVDGLSLYHRADCQALAGRDTGARPRRELAAGTRPCGLCEPDRT